MCTCNNQLQPHDRLTGVCPEEPCASCKLMSCEGPYCPGCGDCRDHDWSHRNG